MISKFSKKTAKGLIKNRKKFKPISRKLIIYIILASFIPIATISLGLTWFTTNSIKNSYIDERARSVGYIMNNIDKKVEWADNLSRQLFVDEQLKNVLRQPSSEPANYNEQIELLMQDIRNRYRYTPLYEKMLALVIWGNNGTDLRFGPYAGLLTKSEVEKTEWFLESSDKPYTNWGGLEANTWQYLPVESYIPLYINLTESNHSESLGYAFILFDQSLFEDAFMVQSDSEGFFLFNGSNQLLAQNDEFKLENTSLLYEALLTSEAIDQSGYNYLSWDDYLISWNRSASTDWFLIDAYPLVIISQQRILFTWIILLVFIFLMIISGILSILISRKFTKPVELLVKQVEQIGLGELNQEPACQEENEIGILSHSIHDMQTGLKQLIDHQLRQEKEKHELEIKMLQNQINPHFLYNTLNTIKLMAQLQGVIGIEKMTVSLGSLLRYAIREPSEKVTLRQELKALEAFMYIQNIRYKGSIIFSCAIADQKLEDAIIPKMILQPIVENAIQHGLSLEDNNGRISIEISSRQEELQVYVMDNGKGFSEIERINMQNSLNEKEKNLNDFSEHIGLINVHQRIVLQDGPEYGINIHSDQKKETCISIKMKLRYT